MTYATQHDLIERYGERALIELTDRHEPPTGAIDGAIVARALADADHEIDARVSVQYALPLDPVPPILNRLAGVIAWRLLHERPNEDVQDEYDRAIKLLAEIAAGRASLGADGAGQAPETTGGPQFTAPERVFTRDTLADF